MARAPAVDENRQAAGLRLGYSTLPGVADEMVDGSGNIRPVWHQATAALAAMSDHQLHERFARADRYLRDAGVFYHS
ncbi:MAG TPA: hypothetical protein VGO22_23400, partial [Pseudorhizobium sp.]|nr:hypothetical protein [Pseudorhizobium sp.]